MEGAERRLVMIPSSTIRDEFLHRLGELFREYGADLTAEDHWTGYAECGEDIRMTICIPSVYRGADCIREYTEIDLGASFSPFAGGAAMSEKLKPCPFCGGEKTQVRGVGCCVFIACDTCDARGPLVPVEDMDRQGAEILAVKNWNQRGPIEEWRARR